MPLEKKGLLPNQDMHRIGEMERKKGPLQNQLRREHDGWKYKSILAKHGQAKGH